ncbi:MAG: hypothetical protein NTV22_20465 [bacterium]|nr:hypothetical protein [bacterium]
MTGPHGARFENILLRGGQRAFQHNNYGYTSNTGNTGPVLITHCTFVEQCNPGGPVNGVLVYNDLDPSYAPTYLLEDNIFGDMPNALRPEAISAIGLDPNRMTTALGEYQMQAYSNQFWSIGVPVPGENFWNANVIVDDGVSILNYTNEVPAFETVGGLPYSTQLETAYGTRDVGWNVVPEPAALGIAALALLALRRRR